MDKRNIFPKGFLWGASTASHQVEGGTKNQWSVWELAHAKELAKTAEERLSWLETWPTIKDQATNPENYISGNGVEHFKRYQEDFDILKQLNLNTFRFGIEWSRIEPRKGVWDASGIEHYRTYIAELKKRGITPVLNIWHWTHPVWFDELGGFSKKSNLKYFLRFVEKVSNDLLRDVPYVITLNEPNVYTSLSYLTGEWPPQEKSPIKAFVVYKNLYKAHKKAYKIIKKQHPYIKIGVAAQLANIQPKNPNNFVDIFANHWMRYFWNWWFLNRIRNHQDFVGFNYYFTDHYRGFKRDNPKSPTSDLGWYMEPEGVFQLLKRIWVHYKKPIMLTENGLADAEDKNRQWWLEETMVALERALAEGVEVEGYLHWSLLDNFEWAYGWWPKFGLVHVDRATMKRTIRPSAKWWAKELAKLK